MRGFVSRDPIYRVQRRIAVYCLNALAAWIHLDAGRWIAGRHKCSPYPM